MLLLKSNHVNKNKKKAFLNRTVTWTYYTGLKFDESSLEFRYLMFIIYYFILFISLMLRSRIKTNPVYALSGMRIVDVPRIKFGKNENNELCYRHFICVLRYKTFIHAQSITRNTPVNVFCIIQGVPINMVKWRLLYRLCSMRYYFVKIITVKTFNI